MATLIPVAATAPGAPRFSAQAAYNGRPGRSVQVTIVCPTWDAEDPTNHIQVHVQQSFDGGVTWEDFAILDTYAARRGRTGNMPTIMCQVVDGLGARLARLELDVTAPITIGVDGAVV